MIEVRDATLEDAEAILKIYDYYVKNTAITFECDTPTLTEFKGRMEEIMSRYPLPEIYPWVSGIFVDEIYRDHRISESLIAFANECAREKGFDKTYIPSIHVGLYEKYGYHYVKDIVNYSNETDRLYVKEI